MAKRDQKIFVIIALGFVVIGVYYSMNADTVFSKAFEPFMPVDWDEVHDRNILKNSIPIELIEKMNGDCKVSALKFAMITDQDLFVRSEELVNELQFDRENTIIILPCDELEAEKSRLNVWFVTEESSKHPNKYEYFITPWDIPAEE